MGTMVGRPIPKNHPERPFVTKSQVINSSKPGAQHAISNSTLEKLVGANPVSPYQPPTSHKKSYKDFWNHPSKSPDPLSRPTLLVPISTSTGPLRPTPSKATFPEPPFQKSIPPETLFKATIDSKAISQDDCQSTLPPLTKKSVYKKYGFVKKCENEGESGEKKEEEVNGREKKEGNGREKEEGNRHLEMDYPREPGEIKEEILEFLPVTQMKSELGAGERDYQAKESPHLLQVSELSQTLILNEGSAFGAIEDRGDNVSKNKAITALVKGSSDKDYTLAYANSEMCTQVNLQTNITTRAFKHGMEGKRTITFRRS